jgi:hypothetical protein
LQAKKKRNDYAHISKGWVEYDNWKRYYMKSRMEMNYGRYLDFLLRQKQIKDWQYEPDTFWFEKTVGKRVEKIVKIKRGVNNYRPDFKITLLNNEVEYHETKGYLDAKSVTKLKRMRVYHPDIKLRFIDATAFKAISKWAKVIPLWNLPKFEKPNVVA